jgi:hypothetical protein
VDAFGVLDDVPRDYESFVAGFLNMRPLDCQGIAPAG